MDFPPTIFLEMNELRVTNSYFEHNNYATHKSTLPHIEPEMLDVISVSKNGFKRVHDCKLFNWSVDSDHSGVIMKMAMSTIKHTGEQRVAMGVTKS